MAKPCEIEILLATDPEVEIDAADNPVDAARQMIRQMDAAIACLRAEERTIVRQSDSAFRTLERAQQEVADWTSRAERAVDEGKDDMARSALKRKQDKEREVQSLEPAWWQAEEERKTLASRLRRLEDLVQRARRRKERHVARSRGERSSSDFVPVAAPRSSSQAAPVDSSAVEDELRKLKKGSSGRA